MVLASYDDDDMIISDNESVASADSTSIFSDDPADDTSDSSVSDDESEKDLDSEDSDSDEEEDHFLYEDEVEHPPEYYLAAADTLDVSQLRQQRYSPRTQEKLEETRHLWNRYCRFTRRVPKECFHALDDPDEAARFLYGFLTWRCDRRRGKGGRRCPGIKSKTSLETFWKWWHLIYKAERGQGLDPLAMKKMNDVIAKIAVEKKLRIGPRPKPIMYIEDLAEFARVLLTTREMTFEIGWQRIQLLLFCQLAAITGSRPEALLNVRYRDLYLRLIRDSKQDRPRLLIDLTLSSTKKFLEEKPQDPFTIPEIIFDPTLILSPHVFLLGMLFRLQAFKSPSITSPERLYELGVLQGLNQQDLPLKDEFLDQYVFCQAIRESDGVRIVLDQRLSGGSLRYRLRRSGQITGFDQPMRPYALRYGAAKAFNNSPDISNELQNIMLQHADVRTFVHHYSVGIEADAQAAVRGMTPEKYLIRLARSMSASIDPRRPWRITPELSRAVDKLERVMELARRVLQRRQQRDGLYDDFKFHCRGFCRRKKANRAQKKRCHPSCRRYHRAESKYQRVNRLLRNEKQCQRNRVVRENLERYKREQPVIDSERQLSGKVVDEEVLTAFQQSGAVTPQLLRLMDGILTMPEATVEAELGRRIRGIYAVIDYSDVEEGAPLPRRPLTKSLPIREPPLQKAEQNAEHVLLRESIASVFIKEKTERPVICFLCVGNSRLPVQERTRIYNTPGSLSRHFVRKHAKPMWPRGKKVQCTVCSFEMDHKKDLLIHAEEVHGTVSRVPPSKLGL